MGRDFRQPGVAAVSRLFTNPAEARSGITLIEMLLVVGLISLLAGISFPAIAAGIDAVRLRTAADSIASFLNSALNRAERRQQVIEVEIDRSGGALRMRSAEPGLERKLDLPEGIRIDKVLPALPVEEDAPRRFLFYPGGTVPRLGVEIANTRGARRIVSVNPITGVPQVDLPQAP